MADNGSSGTGVLGVLVGALIVIVVGGGLRPAHRRRSKLSQEHPMGVAGQPAMPIACSKSRRTSSGWPK